MFRAGHVALLRAARALGDFLIVGVHDDATVRRLCGPAQPLMGLHERAMSVLGCRFADDVVFGPPWLLSQEFIASLQIAVVVRSRLDDEIDQTDAEARYDTPRALDIYAEIPAAESEFPQLRVSKIIRRVCDQQSHLLNRVLRKSAVEGEYYRARYGLGGAELAALTSASGSLHTASHHTFRH